MKDCDLAYGYKTVVTWLNGSVEAGEALALIGPNGSGKTTFLQAIIGIVRVSHGSLTMPKTVSIGYVPQQVDLDLTFPITARQVVAMGLSRQTGFLGLLKKSQKKSVEDALNHVGLLNRADVRFGDLSGGQRQRILLARAIVARPTLILLDEPFNGLDEPNRKELLNIMKSAKEDGISFVVSTHDLVIADAICEKALLLAGRQVAFGPLRKVMTKENISLAYGGSMPAASAGITLNQLANKDDSLNAASVTSTFSDSSISGTALGDESNAS
ncbi:metal ABC transporter ATP-binding protein [Gardnerella vaginalis]|uniref:metal ABC transporter ATP-binding protein n=1 Tax=Gardnerella vaginalis TaxID=2702 RepID=UPI000C79A630|nr:metal ABC transporter ATP-binding protein [Gardnerella vaginalis]PKZ46192.1 ABC transporter ATP-binding protein [Gardnerella vaginalis]